MSLVQYRFSHGGQHDAEANRNCCASTICAAGGTASRRCIRCQLVKLTWKANGLDLLLTSIRRFDKEQFSVLVENFEKTAAGRREPHLILRLKALALNPKLRWTVELYCSLLWWATGELDRNSAAAARALWIYLFGRPIPRCCKLDTASNSYELDVQRWKKWYERLAAG